jgi:hypothetical protein
MEGEQHVPWCHGVQQQQQQQQQDV